VGRARELLAEAVRLDPRLAPAWFSLGRALERLGRAAEARDAYQRFLALAPPAAAERDHAEAYLSRTGAERADPAVK
jgi:cytochrome c-type biogenesis protein CcmH/NrfG